MCFVFDRNTQSRMVFLCKPWESSEPTGGISLRAHKVGNVGRSLWIGALTCVCKVEALVEASAKDFDAECARRVDIRKTKRVFTIDPFTARDLDDAISIERVPGTNYVQTRLVSGFMERSACVKIQVACVIHANMYRSTKNVCCELWSKCNWHGWD